VKATLVPGLRNIQIYDVTPDRTTGHVARSVLATPSMIGLIEWACFGATAEHIDEGETTVGIHVCVSHEAPVLEGESIEVRVALQEVEGHKLTFGVEVLGPRGRVSEGTHRRAVIKLPA
jgi:fluoroacetyl-CoA thioesterase